MPALDSSIFRPMRVISALAIPKMVIEQQFQIQRYMGISASLIEISFNKIQLFYRLDKSETACILENGLGDVA